MKSTRWWQWLRNVTAVLATLLAIWVVGAVVAQAMGSLGSGLRSGLALTASLLLAVVLPLWLEHRITKAIRRRDASATPVRASALLAFNLIVLLVATLAATGLTRSGLEQQASWPTFGHPVQLLEGAARGVARLLPARSTEPVALPLPSPASATASAAKVDASSGEGEQTPSATASAAPTGSTALAASSAAALDAGPPAVADHDLDAKALYELRAASAVLIRTRNPVSPSSMEAKLWGATVTVGQASGTLLDPNGLVVTNYHVIDGATALLVRLHDSRSFGKVAVVATLKKHDLALLSVEAEGLPYAPLAEVMPQIGERVFAIGNPLGLDFSLSEGMVSAQRVQQGTSMLQIQTAIGPGSSGGPLFDARGRVVGLTTAVSGAGLHFAVEAQHLRELLALERTRKVLAPWIDATRVEALEIEGPEIGPTAKANLQELAALFGTMMEPCLAPAGPESAKLRIHLPRAQQGDLEFDSTKAPETTLEGDQAECAAKAAKSAAFFFAAALPHLIPSDSPDKTVVRFRLVRPREGGGQRAIDVEIAVDARA